MNGDKPESGCSCNGHKGFNHNGGKQERPLSECTYDQLVEEVHKRFTLGELVDELRRREGVAVTKYPDLQQCASAWICTRQRLGTAVQARHQDELSHLDTNLILREVREEQKVVYGVDDRDDMYDVDDPAVLRNADGVVALVSSTRITDNADGTSTLQWVTHRENRRLCPSEPFGNQIVPADCTGFLVDPSFVVTAGHCVNSSNMASVRFVFGFEMDNASTVATIQTRDIYSGLRIIGRQDSGTGQDWAVVQLDRPVLDRRPLSIRRTRKIEDNEAVYVIGHPSGLPKKYAPGATVRSNSDPNFFVANLDTYGGNSGSPVFSSATHQVEGVLVRGETDFIWNGSCMVSNVCSMDGCRGEDCTRTTVFDHLVPDARLDCIPFNPDLAQVQMVRRTWKIMVGRRWMLDFGSERGEADKALKIIKHYRLNWHCFVGRPNASMEFWLVNGEAPEGGMPGEDSISFNPSRLRVERFGSRWKITEGRSWLLDFGWNEAEARQGLSHILRYGFTRICYVGRPGPSMVYFRK